MRTWIFPSLRILIFLVISLALVKMAFFSGALDAGTAEIPTAQLDEPLTTVDLGTITNNVVVSSSIVADPAITVSASLAGDVKKVLAKAGQAVVATTPVLSIHSAVPSEDGTVVNKTVTVVAGSAGVLASISVQVGQIVAVGDAVAQVSPQTFSVTGTLPPEQQYRLLNKPSEGQVAIKGGPAPFTCTAVTISSPAAAGATGSNVSTSSDSSSSAGGTDTSIRCAVPAAVTVFSGLAATLTVAGGVAADVLIIPTTAVQGSVGAGTVYLRAADGTTKATPITLGLRDGTNVHVTGGLKQGDQILQFVPGAEAADASPSGDPSSDNSQMGAGK